MAQIAMQTMPGEATDRGQTLAEGLRSTSGAPRHLLHVFPSFGLGGVPIRIATIVNHLGPAYRHTIVALDGNHDSRCRIEPSLDVAYDTPDRTRFNLLQNLRRSRLSIAAHAPDTLLTYNWGAIEWALANRVRPLCRHIHLESGFGVEEAEAPLRRRVLFRRLALGRIDLLIVPSEKLVRMALDQWRIPERKVRHIPNGVDLARFETAPRDGWPENCEPPAPEELVIGTLSPLRPEKNIARLIEAFAATTNVAKLRLVIAGEGPERPRLEALARDSGRADRITFTGHVEAIDAVLPRFDIFALSSDTEQMPNSLLQAMASGCAVASVDVGDVRQIVAPANRPFIVAKTAADLAAAFDRLAANPELRATLGRRNRDRVRVAYDAEKMFAAYAKALAGRP